MLESSADQMVVRALILRASLSFHEKEDLGSLKEAGRNAKP